MHTGQLEGINNHIKVIKRTTYGYRVSEFFFMKIKAALLEYVKNQKETINGSG